MNLFDGLAAVYAVVAAMRGFRMGAAEEVARLVRLAISVLAGCGLFALVDKGVGAASDAVRSVAGGFGFVAGLGVVYVAVRKIKGAAVSFLQRYMVGKYSRLIGGAIGFVRALTVVSVLIAFLQLSPWIPGVKSAIGSSVVWRVVGSIARPGENAKDAGSKDYAAETRVTPSPRTD